MTNNRTRIGRTLAAAVFTVSLVVGAQAFTPATFADCSTPIGSNCKDSTAKTGGSLERSVDDTSGQTELTLDLPQLRILFDLIGALV
jgi:hypothetical protein